MAPVVARISAGETKMRRRSSVFAAPAMPASALLSMAVASASICERATLQRSSAAAMAAMTASVVAPVRQPIPATIMASPRATG